MRAAAKRALSVPFVRPDADGFAAYQTFARQLGVDAPENGVVSTGERFGVERSLAWLTSAPADFPRLRAAI